MRRYQYGRRPEVGKAFVTKVHGQFRIYKYDKVDANGTSSTAVNTETYDLDEAYEEVCKMNDWQNLRGHVFKNLQGLSMKPYEHAYLLDGVAYIFIWDTREFVRAAKFRGMTRNTEMPPDSGTPISQKGRWLYRSELQRMQVATEDDGMPISDGDNTTLAPDVSNSADPQSEIGVVKQDLLTLFDASHNKLGTYLSKEQMLSEHSLAELKSAGCYVVRLGKIIEL
jgi:hypothetical protein